MTDKNKILLIGLPETGKTSFLAALWHVITSDEISSCLGYCGLDGDYEHLNALTEKWVVCEELPRTSVQAEQLTSIKMKSKITKEEIVLFFPDMSGESFEKHWENREWSNEFYDYVKNSLGALLFIHPRTLKKPVSIQSAQRAMAELSDEPIPNDDNEETPWDPKLSPTQVKLIELIQFIVDEESTPNPFKIALIISAWDLEESGGLTPKRWIETHLPMLYQFITANPDSIEMKAFGISAQGAEHGENLAQLAESLFKQSERIKVVEDSKKSHSDITAPIYWLV